MARKFWGMVHATGRFDDDACWRASPRRKKDCYGVTIWGSRRYGSHVVSWMLYNGRHVAPGREILHSCDRGWCVNPTHLAMGTHAENMRDKAEKGRTGRAKLSVVNVRAIRRLRATRMYTYQKLADTYGVSVSAIWQACHGEKSWVHVGAKP